jgi:FKBP-type peptidyl-prolyl cis-trans isomerase
MQPKGSSFEGNDKGYLRIKLGDTKVIPAVEEALRGMKSGGIRRLIIPEQLGYPAADYKNWEPSPGTFSVSLASQLAPLWLFSCIFILPSYWK